MPEAELRYAVVVLVVVGMVGSTVFSAAGVTVVLLPLLSVPIVSAAVWAVRASSLADASLALDF